MNRLACAARLGIVGSLAFLFVYYLWQTQQLRASASCILVVSVYLGLLGISGYRSLARLVNRTTILVADGFLTITSNPLPVSRGRRILILSCEQLYAKAVPDRSRIGNDGMSYVLFVATTDGEEVALTEKLQTEREVLHMEQQIERFLGIQDRPVPGEIDR